MYQVAHALKFSCMSTAHPIFPRGIILSNGPKFSTKADTVGVLLDYCSRFSVNSAWGRRRSHWCMGRYVDTPAMMLKKCCLNDLMATSATLS